MESINEESISINNAPPFCSCLGVVALPLYHIGKVQCKPASLSSSTCLIYIHGLRLPFGLCCPKPAHPPCTPCIRFLSVKLRFRYPFFSPIPHDINLGSRFRVRRQLRPGGLSPQTDGMPVIHKKRGWPSSLFLWFCSHLLATSL